MIDHYRNYTFAVCGIICGIGLFMMYWGIMSILTPGIQYTSGIIWLDRFMQTVARFVWVLATGGLLLIIGTLPGSIALARRYDWIRGIFTILCAIAICFGGFLTFASLNRFYGLIYFFPIYFSGLLLGAIAFETHETFPNVWR